jgi:pentapeptide MXKDX repeat protein
MSLDGMSLDGMSLDGMSLDGMSLDGMSLDGMSLDGMSLDGMSLDGMSLDGMSLDGMSKERYTGLGSVDLNSARQWIHYLHTSQCRYCGPGSRHLDSLTSQRHCGRFTHFTTPLRTTLHPPTALDALVFTNFHNAVAAAAQSAPIAVEMNAPVDFTS